jgi:hypothetical protein
MSSVSLISIIGGPVGSGFSLGQHFVVIQLSPMAFVNHGRL